MGRSQTNCRICLKLGAEGVSQGQADLLGAVLEQGAVACVLLTSSPASAGNAGALKRLVELVQAQNIAALIVDDAELARVVRADGVHIGAGVEPVAAYRAARDVLGERAIVGIDVGLSRHMAMSLGEAGADYVAFSLAGGDGDADDLLDQVAWWAEIFEVPCVVAGVATEEAAQTFAAAGADFVIVDLAADAPVDQALGRIAAVRRGIGAVEVA
ncbi:MAG: thiamine phosphate synthase [Hyphomicrobiaceae bacterium]